MLQERNHQTKLEHKKQLSN
jgi:chromosome segregation ATPase